MVSTSKDPDVQVTAGVTGPSTSSIAVSVDVSVPPEGTLGKNAVAGVKVTTGRVVSAP